MMNTNNIKKELTGYPSIDKPWLSYYSNALIELRSNLPKHKRIIDKLQAVWNDPEEVMIDYYDAEIKVGDFFDVVNKVTKSLVSMGIKKGDTIFSSLESVPEYIELLLASELIGCSITDYLGNISEIITLINSNDTVKLYIAPDYLSDFEADTIYKNTSLEHIITIDPLFSVKNKSKLRNNIAEVISSKYSSSVNKSIDKRNIS